MNKRDDKDAIYFSVPSFVKINNVGRPVRRYVARVAKNGVLSGKTFTAGEKNKATFFSFNRILSDARRGRRIVRV